MVRWNEEIFIKRFKAGRLLPGTPMPWGEFSIMSEVELKALFRYLHSLNPVHRAIEKTVYQPGEEFPS